MSELVECHGRGARAAVCAASALVLGLMTLAALFTCSTGRAGQPSDEELTANFLSREAGFDELVQMLAADRPRLTAQGSVSIDLETVARATTNAARFRIYRDLLQQISVEDLRYFPGSGKLVLVPDGEENVERPSKAYLYLPHAQPRALTQYQGYTWRGPGSYVLAGDRPLKGHWFIHHDMTEEVAISPY